MAASERIVLHPISVSELYCGLLYIQYFKKLLKLIQIKLLRVLIIKSMEQRQNSHYLTLTYADYKKFGKSIQNTTIGDYIINQEIGRGAFGAVYKGMNDKTKKPVAVKVLDLEEVEREPSDKVKEIRKRLCKTESEIMMLCNSQNLLKCYDVYENKSLKIMVIEFCNKGTLQDEIDTKVRVPQNQAILILKQIINGIKELHQHKIVHRDLKAENILVHNGVYKIADFGFSKKLQIAHQTVQIKATTLGTITTMAPEVMHRQAYGLKADIWSIGVIFFQMIYGKVPYDSTTAQRMYIEIQNKKILETEKFTFNGYTASKQVTQFLKQCLTIQTRKRLGWKQLVQHKMFMNKQQHLDGAFKLDTDIQMPDCTKEDEYDIKDQNQKKFNGSIKFPEIPNQGKKVDVNVIRMTLEQTTNKMKQLKNDEEKLFKWSQQTFVECLKTQLIHQEIIQKILNHKLLDCQDRDVKEMMYLFSTRCLNNMSTINDKLQKYKDNKSLQNLQKKVKYLYQKVIKNFQLWSKNLSDEQSKVSSMIGDKLKKIFSSQSLKEKDRYLTGIEKSEYTKKEQIDFTYQKYIRNIINEIKNEGKNVSRVRSLLAHYVQINDICLEDLRLNSFEEYVNKLIK